jgi:glycine cleavage system regulatory protein
VEYEKLRTSLVITFIGNDRPGLVERLSQVVSNHDGNWLESRMSQLAGKFAGIVRIGVSSSRIGDLVKELNELESDGLAVLVEESDSSTTESTLRVVQLSIIGLDRPGIVREIAQALSRNRINVIEMTTDITNAPMTGELLFNADAWIEIPESTDIRDLQEQLENSADELAIDIELLLDD